ncbi:MAG: HD domain-containing phosphohydrolase [Planctomycetota bacterium]
MTILIVDDQTENLDLLENILVPHGYRIIKAGDGPTAMAMTEKHPIDLILLDVVMPGMNGFEVARKIKSQKNIPIIFLTTLTERNDLIKGLESGADEFLSKPFFFEELLLRIKNILKIKEYQNTLEAKVEERTKQLGKAFDELLMVNNEMVKRLLVATEFRDDETGQHIIRVGKYSRLIGKRLNLESSYLNLLEQAAPCHDIGKIGIPDKILLKPGKLTLEEFEEMKKHTVIGGHILEGSKFSLVKMAQEIALTHHEKWDGSGYPHGLKDENIPMSGRITAVCDVFDALTSKRPYKPPFSWDKSLAIIKEETGRHFDPNAVEAFFKTLDQIKQIYDEYKESPEIKDSDSDLQDIERRR